MIWKALIRWLLGIIALIMAITVLMMTPLGLKVGMLIATKIIPGDLRYKEASGYIIGPLTITDLTYRHNGRRIAIKKFYLQWQLSALLWGQLSIHNLRASGVRITLPQSSTPLKPKAPPTNFLSAIQTFSLPVSLDIERSHFTQVDIGHRPNEFPTHIKTLNLSGLINHKSVNLKIHAEMLKPYPLYAVLNIHGKPSNYQLQSQGRSQHIRWDVSGKGSTQFISLDIHKVHTLGGQLYGQVTLHWAPQLIWQVNLKGEHLNLRELQRDWPLQFNIQLQSQGKLIAGVPQFTIRSKIHTPDANILVDGKRENEWKLKWNIAINKLSSLLKNASGSIHSQGSIMGSLETPVTKGNLEVRSLHFRNYQAGTLNSQWDINLNPTRFSKFNITGNKLAATALQLKKLQLEGHGLLRKHQIKGAIATSKTQFSFSLIGGLHQEQWNGYIKNLVMTMPTLGRWSLKRSTPLELTKKYIKISTLCLTRNASRQLCLQGTWHAEQAWSLHLTGQHINAQLITHNLPMGLKLSGSMTLKAYASGLGTTLHQLKMAASLSRGRISYAKGVEAFTRPYQHGKMTINFDRQGLKSNLSLQLTGRDYFSAALSLPKYRGQGLPKASQALQGKIHAKLYNLKFLTTFIPDIVIPSSQFVTNLNVGGTLAEPTLSGTANLLKGSIQIPLLEITLTPINIKLAAQRNHLIYTLSAKSGGGSIVATGDTNLSAPGLPTTLLVNAQNLLIMNTPNYIVYATAPALSVRIQRKVLNITGNITLPKATIKPKKFKNVVTLPEDVVFIGKPPSIGEPWQVYAQLSVSLGKEVKLDSMGMTGKLQGNVYISNTKKTGALANGRITLINGRYRAYGQDLTISSTSSVIFRNSPLENPTLNIKASKTIKSVSASTGGLNQQFPQDNLVVGLNIHGTFKNPQITLFSIPATLTQADILSYLILGYSSGNTSKGNLSLLVQAVSALNLGGGGGKPGGITDQIRQGLGFSELGIETETSIPYVALDLPSDIASEQTAFVIGRQLSQRLYIRYSLGLGGGPGITNINLLLLRYQLSKNWVLQTDTSNIGSGIDILYTIEK